MTGDTNTPNPYQQPKPPGALELRYAPPAKSKNRAVWVIAAGLLTTVLTLAGVYFLQRDGDTYIMGWYANYILPAGAIIVGLAASSGYALASWKLGVRIRRGLLAIILLLMLVSYFAAEYVEFASKGQLFIEDPTAVAGFRQLDFPEYFHLRAVTWTWSKKYSTDKEPEPLGMAGYAFVALGIVGFSLSGLALPAIVGKQAYCELCQQYMKTQPLVLLPGSVAHRKISKKDAAGLAQLAQEHQDQHDFALHRLATLVEHAQTGNVEAFKTETAQDKASRKAADKLPRRLDVRLVNCATCHAGWIASAWVTGQGQQIERTELPKVEVSQEFIRAVKGTAATA